jgi:tRNA U34 5-carboxymethylaminomethyl modifying GTPase MnmE/TrmE
MSPCFFCPIARVQQHDTIFQVASGSQKAGVCVIRVSGPKATAALTAMTRSGALPPPRKATVRAVQHPHTQEILDSAAVSLYFPAPHSFTGEDTVEWHVHGSPVVVRDVMAALGTLPLFRMANAGEFTRRAFQNGKMVRL